MQCIEEKFQTVPELLGLLSQKDIDVRWRAATALSKAGSSAVDPLLMKLFDDDKNVRILAIWALGEIGDARVLEAISRAVDSKKGPVSLAAEGALNRMRH